jgi:hypothetical protein
MPIPRCHPNNKSPESRLFFFSKFNDKILTDIALCYIMVINSKILVYSRGEERFNILGAGIVES